MIAVFYVACHSFARHPNVFRDIVTGARAAHTGHMPIIGNLNFFWAKKNPSQQRSADDSLALSTHFVNAAGYPFSVSAARSPAPMAINQIASLTVTLFI